MNADHAERALTYLLRFLGALTLCAVFAVVMPTDWMSVVNDRLGLAPLPRTPLTEYLTRSLSAIYSVLGALTLYVARDVRRYLGFLGFTSYLIVLLGVFFTILDVWAGLPPSWMWFEGPPTILLGFVVRWLVARAAGADPPSEP